MARARTFKGFTTNCNDTHSCGGSLIFEIDASHEQIRDVLGTSLSSERRETYSSTIDVCHIATGFVYRVYMCCGRWRIGSSSEDRHNNPFYVKFAHDLRAILEHTDE